MKTREEIDRKLLSLKKDLTNEQLWWLADQGDETYLVRLYNQVEKIWIKAMPYDNSGLNAFDDWMSIAREEFFTCWMKYNPEKKIKFSTYIYTCIKNRFGNEVVRLHAQKRDGENNKVYESDCEDFVNLIAVGQGNDSIVEIRFCRHLKNHAKVAKDAVDVFNLRVKDSSVAVKELSKNLGISVQSVEVALKDIRSSFENFVEWNKEILSGY
jgi:DNA-directed RNA polymerase specialized sigma subunit